MRPDTQLALMAAGAGFLFKSCIGFCVCYALSRIVSSSHRRFLVWFGFLACAAYYWTWLLVGLIYNQNSVGTAGRSENVAAVGNTWQIQPAWAFAISIALRTLIALYLLGLLYFLFVRIRKLAHLRWILRFAYAAPDEIETVFRPIAERMRVGGVQLRMLSGIHSPATFGWIRPIVLLPQFCLEQDPGELADVFRHELQHVRRRDYLLQTIASICRAFLFFHPASWYALRKLALESELACDQAVIGDSPESRASYAECLVRFARLNVPQEPSPWNLDFVGSSTQLRVRIRSLLTETARIPAWLLGLQSMLALLLIAGFLAVAPSLSIGLSFTQPGITQPDPSVGIVTRKARPFHPRRLRAVGAQAEAAQPARPLEFSAPQAAFTAPVETPVESAPTEPPQERATIPATDPALVLRSDKRAVSTRKSSASTVIELSNEPARERSRFITRGRAFVSAFATAAGEAAQVAGHGHARENR